MNDFAGSLTVVVSDVGKGALEASGGDQEDECRSR
jgi:hypothetical protein